MTEPDIDIDPATIHDAQRAQIAQRRYREETRGISVDGQRYATDRDSQAQIERACAALADDATIHWKTRDGFVELNAPQLGAVRDAIRAHVQACFDREAALLATLAAGGYADTLLGTGWPA